MLEHQIDDAVRTLLRRAASEPDDYAIRLLDEIPLTVQQLDLCTILEEDPAAYRAERDAHFAAAWCTHRVAALDEGDLFGLERTAIEVLELTEQFSAAESLLVIIGWRMASDRVPRMEERNQELRELIATARGALQKGPTCTS